MMIASRSLGARIVERRCGRAVMTGTAEPVVNRTVSEDGAEIGWVSSGTGPPLLPHLEPHVTVHAMDRRGRGLSSEGPDYGVVREFEDVAAVVDAVAERSGSPPA
jgi:pimeloyl-ACP methyl ester carboxylesterase